MKETLRMPWAVCALKFSANDQQVCLTHYDEKTCQALYQINVLNSYHQCSRVIRFRRWRICCKPIENARVMVVTRHCQQGADIIRYASLDIVTAKIACIAEQAGHIAQFPRQSTQLRQGRLYLLFVVCCLLFVVCCLLFVVCCLSPASCAY